MIHTIKNVMSGLFIVSLYAQEPESLIHARYLTSHLFGTNGTQLPYCQKDSIATIIEQLLTASNFQLLFAAKKTAHLLQKTVTEKQEQLNEEPYNTAVKTALFITEIQKGHLEEYYQKTVSSLTIFEYIITIIKLWFNYDATTATSLATSLAHYCQIEQEYLFTDYTKAVTFFALQDKYKLPAIITFFDEPLLQNILLTKIKETNYCLQIQIEIAEDAAETAETALGEDITAEGGDITATQEAKDLEATSQLDENILENTNLETVAQNVKDTLEQEPETTEEPELTSAERKDNYLTNMRKARAAQQEAEDEILNNPYSSKFSKKWIRLKRFFSHTDPTTNTFWDKVNAYYKAYIYDTIIAPLEDNFLHESLEKLPMWLRMPTEMMMQMSIMSGGGMVTTWIDQDDEQVYQEYASQQLQMGAIISRITTETTLQKTKKMNAAQTALQTELEAIQKMSTNQITQNNEDTLYLDQAIALSPVVENFTVQGQDNQTVMQIDQMFAQSALLTPECISPDLQTLIPSLGSWHNVFQSGNWIYYYPINGFYQTQQVPLTGATALEKGAQVLYNSIFREYIPTEKQNYTIQVQCTLINHAPEFFVGIIFNNARWISGIPDRYHQHRFAGIFGTNKKLYQVCEESSNNPSGTQPNTAWPVYKILQNSSDYMIKNNSITLRSLPTTFTFTITTTPTAATLQLTLPESISRLSPITQTNLNASVFNYHGIGLTAAGCSAQFTIIQPQALTYTSKQVHDFTTLVTQNQEATT